MGAAPAAMTAVRALSVLSNRSLISRSRVAVMRGPTLRAAAHKLQRNHAAELSARGVCPADHHRSRKHIHREAFARERGETEITGQWHLENLDVFHDGDGVVPLRARPVVPDLPQEAAQEPAEREIH